MQQYTSGEVARAIGITPATLRKWSKEFAEWLTPSARPVVRSGSSRDRRYAEADLKLLQRVAVYVDRNWSYSQIRTRLATDIWTIRTEEQVVAAAPAPAAPIEEAQIQFEEQDIDETGAYAVWGAEEEAVLISAAEVIDEAVVVDAVAAEGATSEQAPAVVGAPSTNGHGAEVVLGEVVQVAISANVASTELMLGNELFAGLPIPMTPEVAVLMEQITLRVQVMMAEKDGEIETLQHALDSSELRSAAERNELDTLSNISVMVDRENQRLRNEVDRLQEQLQQLQHSPSSWWQRLFRRENTVS